jgi:hypothetical protein
MIDPYIELPKSLVKYEWGSDTLLHIDNRDNKFLLI